MHAELTQKLRQLRLSADVLPKKGKPPKLTTSSQGDEAYAFLALCLIPTLLAFIYCISKHIPFYYTFHLMAQVVVVMLGANVANQFFKRLVRFSGAWNWI